MKKTYMFIFISLLVISCNKNDETVLIIKEHYAPSNWSKEGLIKGDLYVSSIDKPLYSDIRTDISGEIKIKGLLEGTYLFRFFVKPVSPDEYWPIPRDTVFQVWENKENIIVIK